MYVLNLLRNQIIRTMLYGAGERNRTPDRLITNQLLYLLSYASLTRVPNLLYRSGAQIVLIATPRVKW